MGYLRVVGGHGETDSASPSGAHQSPALGAGLVGAAHGGQGEKPSQAYRDAHCVAGETERGMIMTHEKRESAERRPEKTGHHIYSLQGLQTEKFIKLIDKVLRQEYYLVK